MGKEMIIEIFGRRVKVVNTDDLYTPCEGCALEDICDRLYGNDDYICSTADGTYQKFVDID